MVNRSVDICEIDEISGFHIQLQQFLLQFLSYFLWNVISKKNQWEKRKDEKQAQFLFDIFKEEKIDANKINGLLIFLCLCAHLQAWMKNCVNKLNEWNMYPNDWAGKSINCFKI